MNLVGHVIIFCDTQNSNHGELFNIVFYFLHLLFKKANWSELLKITEILCVDSILK